MEILTPTYIRERRKELRENHRLSERDPRVSWINMCNKETFWNRVFELCISQTKPLDSFMPMFVLFTTQLRLASSLSWTSRQDKWVNMRQDLFLEKKELCTAF